MSFSSEMKEDLSKIANLNNKELVKYELLGYLMSNNTTVNKKEICYSTVNEYNINRFSKLLTNLGILKFQIELKGKTYKITLQKINEIEEIDYDEKNISLTSKFIEQLEKIEKVNTRRRTCYKIIYKRNFLRKWKCK